MSYTRTVTSNGNSISQEGGQSFNQQLDALEEQIGEGGGAPDGTGFVKVTDGAYDTPGPLSADDITGAGGALQDDLDDVSTVANAAVPKSLVDAKGDILVGTADNTVARQAIGTNGQVLTADSAQTNGLKWADVSATDSTKLPVDGSGSMTNRLSWTGTQTSAGNGVANIFRDVGGNLWINIASGCNLNVTENGSARSTLGGPNGFLLYGTQTSVGNSYNQIWRDSSGNTNHNVDTGLSHIFKANGARVGGFPLMPSDMPYSQAGTTFANDGNWYNLYSLAQGTHNGEIKIACALFGGLVTFTINGTSISLINDGWGGSFADTTAASGKIAFRVSGGYLQINVGTGISSTPKKFSAIFMGTVN